MKYDDNEARAGIEAQGLTESKYRMMASALGVSGAMSNSIGKVMYDVINGGYTAKAQQQANLQRKHGDRS